MRNLYWKIFLTFWLTTILIIASTAWITSEIAQQAFITRHIEWQRLSLHLLIAVLISGIICYLLSIYLTKPLRSLRMAAKLLAAGKLNTRVGHFLGHNNDEIAELSHEFDGMAERLETLITSKQRLLQDISHELRSPLARIQVAIELARKKSNNLAENEFQRMELECSRLNTLIGEIIYFARLDKSTNTLKKVRVDLHLLIESIVNDANFEFSKQAPRVLISTLQPCRLKLDERLIHRAIENILRNALRYSNPTQQVIISLHVSESNKTIEIDIKDKGPGVPNDQLTKIFEPFYRVDKARVKRTGGYGLGLAIAQQAVQMHEGSIVAKNLEEGGLLVKIILPRLTCHKN